ncbi:MAG: hypothetical protein WA048_01735 [Minisyncoccia bacterium]
MDELPDIDLNETKTIKTIRAGMEIAAGVVPLVGGFLSAAASAWSGDQQERVNGFFKHWLQMLADEIKEKEQTIVEIMARLDLQDTAIQERLDSVAYQSLLKKAFRDWSAAESEDKRKLIRNILANAAGSTVTSDEVVVLFLDWLRVYSELHFKVIAVVYNHGGISRGEIWKALGKEPVKEDSADADLFKLLIGDLSMGHVIHQHRQVDGAGRTILQSTLGSTRAPSGSTRYAKSAFDNDDRYELTRLGNEFVHYAMTDLPLKIAAPTDGTFS